MKLVTAHGLDDVLAWRPGGPVRVREFLADAQALAAVLPPNGGVLNLCDDRYHFAVLFAACALRGCPSLQPASQSVQTLQHLADSFPGCVAVGDGSAEARTAVAAAGLPHVDWPELSALARSPVTAIPEIDDASTVAVLFTSGSTGQPQAHAKTWGRLVRNGRAEAQALGLDQRPQVLVGTVPVQHSYGFESTFLLALHGGCSFWAGKPFYPQDVVDALAAVPQPRMLVTTPFHLSALLASGLAWPAVDCVLSATAPLSAELAQAIEHRGGAPVHEIYGSTESGQLATRRTLDGPAWRLLPGVELTPPVAHGGHVEGRVPLSDLIELLDDGRFLLLGRQADMVNIAGKRSSLAYLTHQLLAIDGVEDGAFFLPDDATDVVDALDASDGRQTRGAEAVTRLVALVVAPGLSTAQVQAALRPRIDRVFLPRPLLKVDALPRNSTGKLLRSTLQALYRDATAHGRSRP